MNFIKMADGVSGLLPKKNRVTLIRASTKEKIGDYKFREEQLPEKFDKPTLLEAGGKVWRIIEANLVRESSYLFSKRLVLTVEDPGLLDLPGLFTVPSSAYGALSYVEKNAGENIFTLTPDDWRQFEFLRVDQIALIQAEIENVDRIINPIVPVNTLLGYQENHIRSEALNNSLKISFEEFVELVEASDAGFVSVKPDHMIENGFSINSERYIYYGRLDENVIVELAIHGFESVDDEVLLITSRLGLVLVDWCNARLLMEPPEDAPEKDIVTF